MDWGEATEVSGEYPVDGPISERYGRFEVLHPIGEGASGRVFAARDEQLDRTVAVKVLKADVDERSKARLMLEATSLARLSHPNVVSIFEVGREGDQQFIAMELVRGEPLDAWQAAPGRTWTEIIEVYVQAAAGLAAAHGEGLIHRDFKPHNVMVNTEGERPRALVLDFGIVRVGSTNADTWETSYPENSVTTDRLTQTGGLLGTPAYMAPEQFSDAAVSAAADQFSFCVSVWEALWGERPFKGSTVTSLVTAMLSGPEPKAPRNSAVPRRVERILRRGINIAPDQRWPSMTELAAALSPRSRSARWPVAGLSLALLASAAASVHLAMAEPADRCDAREVLGEAWTDARRNEVREAAARTGKDAEIRWAPVSEYFDDYAQSWSETYQTSCESAESDNVEHLARRSCLLRIRERFDGLTRMFTDAPEEVFDDSALMFATLTPASVCLEPATRARTVPPRPTDDAREGARAVALLVNQAWVAHIETDYRKSLRLANEALERASDVDFVSSRVIALLIRAKALANLQRHDAARRDNLEAFRLASSTDDLSSKREAAIALVQGSGNDGHLEDAAEFGPIAEGLIESDWDRAWLDHALAVAALNEGRFAEAEERLSNALQIARRSPGRSQRFQAGVLRYKGRALRGLERFADAEIADRQARDIFLDRDAPSHPSVVAATVSLAEDLLRQGRHAEASVETQRVLDSLTGEPSRFPGELRRFARLYERLGYRDEALRLASESIERSRTGSDAVEQAQSEHMLAIMYERARHWEDSEAHSRRALELRQNSVDPNALELASTLTVIGYARLAQNDLDEAERLHLRALALREDALAPGHLHFAYSWQGLAEVAERRGNTRKARRLARRAWHAREDSYDDPRRRASNAFLLARALLADEPTPENRDEAVGLATFAAETYRDFGSMHAQDVSEIEAWLEANGLVAAG